MPPASKYKREDIITAAYEIVKKEGMADLNARRIAKQLGCSTQPIYRNFETMAELKDELVKKIYGMYISCMQNGAKEQRAYLGMGMAYIRFAKKYPKFFELLFMRRSSLSPIDFIQNDVAGSDVLEKGRLFTGLTAVEQRAFHLQVWIFTHGLATLAATETVSFTDDEIKELLISATREMLVGFKHMKTQEANK